MFISTNNGLMVADLSTITNSNTNTTIKIINNTAVYSSSFYNDYLFACAGNRLLIFKF